MIRINVTQSDIERGRRESAAYCPVARAMSRRKALGQVYVDSDAFSRAVDLYEEHTLPEKVVTFIHRFDSGKPVKPISFEIEVPA